MSGIKSGTGNMGNDGILDINANQLKAMMDGAIKTNLYEESPLAASNFRTLETNNDIYSLGYDWRTAGIPVPYTETLEETIKRVVGEEVGKALGRHTQTVSRIYGIEKYHLKHK